MTDKYVNSYLDLVAGFDVSWLRKKELMRPKYLKIVCFITETQNIYQILISMFQ